MASGFERALIFGAFLESLSAPTPSQLWLERAAAQLRQERDPDGSRKKNRDKLVARLLVRDGADCWFCGKHLGQDITLEHLTPLALQGGWNDDNLALAHKACNKAAGHLTRFEKERLRDEMRGPDSILKGSGK
jgi:5-methylcytosine-specific restriction endonuclease McrA